jgi:hypothetical protein
VLNHSKAKFRKYRIEAVCYRQVSVVLAILWAHRIPKSGEYWPVAQSSVLEEGSQGKLFTEYLLDLSK